MYHTLYLHSTGRWAMFEDRTKVLLVIPQEVLGEARAFAGEATSKLKRPVSLQMVLRAFIDEGLKRDGDKAVLSNIEAQVQAVREIRSRAGRDGSRTTDERTRPSRVRRTMSRGTR
jgi:hypothetical protein